MAISILLEIVGFNRNAVRRFVPADSMGWDDPWMLTRWFCAGTGAP
jgi:hypothetical protein